MFTTKYFTSSPSSSSISSSFASVFLVSSLFALACFSFLYLHYPHQHLLADVEDDHTIHYIQVSINPPMSPIREAKNDDTYGEDRPIESYVPEPLSADEDHVNSTSPLDEEVEFDEDLNSPPMNREDVIKIFESTNKSTMFEQRILEFFLGCEVRFFMVWISSSSLFGKRELLSLESVLKAHPRGCVVIVSKTMDSNLGRDLLEPILRNGLRVLPVAPDLSLLDNTPADPWLEGFQAGEFDSETQNLSNLLRIVLLYKYGGVYLDADVIILKDISSLRNCVGIQNVYNGTGIFKSLSNAVLIFDQKHPLLLKFIERFTTQRDGNTWGYNGHNLLTRVVVNFTHTDGYNFDIMSPTAFFPVSTNRLSKYFRRPENENETQWTYDEDYILKRESYTVHLINHVSRKLKIEENSLIGRIFSEHCIICKDVYDIDNTPSISL